MDGIRTENLTKYYGKTMGIENMNLTVEEGDFFGFIGPNGAGKSTTIRTLLGLIRPTGGAGKIFGRDIVSQNKEILSLVGYMPSEIHFYGGMKVKDVIRLSASLRGKDCSREAERLCDRLRLNVDKRVDQLSLGNRKKVAIVCTLQHEPQLCILDEPTSGLDPLMQREFFSILEEYNRAGTTIFFSSHVLSEVERYCKHGAVIRNGKILVQDSISRLRETSAKRVTLRSEAVSQGTNSAMERALEDSDCSGCVKDVQENGDTVSFLYSGEIPELLGMLASLPLTDLTITEPDLEEIFLHYYEEAKE
ncbi:MAG: ABC transporter ATP-binding protein [Firmicutes bacterium]|nr:ABC transporter ATP-binding protein [Bacillota bacterium]